MLASLCMRFLLMYRPISDVLTPFPACVTFSNTLGILRANQWHPGDLGSACSGSHPCVQSRTNALPVYFPHCADEETEEDLNLPAYTALAVLDLHCTQPIHFSEGISIFSLLMLFRKPCESFPNTSIVSVHTFLMRLPSVAKEFACYSRVLVNLRTIAPNCLLLWQKDRHCSLGLTFFQICTLSKTEDLRWLQQAGSYWSTPLVQQLRKRQDFQEDVQKDSFPRAKYSSKWNSYPKIKDN